MLDGIKDLFASGRGVFGLLLVLISAVFAALGKITFAEWKDFSLYVFGVFATAKTATTIAGIIKGDSPTVAHIEALEAVIARAAAVKAPTKTGSKS